MNKNQFLHTSIPFGICMHKEGKTPLRLHCGNYNTLVDNEKRIPIVHPLSDLNKLIIHNGEKFVPIVHLGWYINLKEWSESNTKFAIENISFNDAKQLIEWHFNLMDENEPFIDVNALSENPYK